MAPLDSDVTSHLMLKSGDVPGATIRRQGRGYGSDPASLRSTGLVAAQAADGGGVPVV